MSDQLFSDFAPMDKNAWAKQAQKELKEKFGSATSWDVGSGLRFNSYATYEDLDAEKVAAMQQCQKKVPGWLNVPELEFSHPLQTNLALKNALENGADAALINLGHNALSQCEFPKLLHGIRLTDTPIYFQTSENPEDLFSHISKNASYYLKGGIAFDPVADWMRYGKSFETRIESVAAVLTRTKNMREFRPVMVETHVYHNNGADPVQELAFTTAATVTYMDHLTDAGISPLGAFNRMLFSVSIGTQYLTEIAKLRAFRFLLRNISRAYALPDELSNPFIQAQTSSFYSSTAAPFTNMIRASSEAMSGTIGGCNALTVSGYVANAASPNDLSGRVARNLSSVLYHESAFGTVADPAAGSYLLEKMSIDLAEQSWSLFLDIEEKGGLVECFERGFIKEELGRSLTQKIQTSQNKGIMVGVNKFTEPGEDTDLLIKNPPQTESPFLSHDKSLSECFKSRPASL
ncbi:methylmalonyl-CoA mutase family protein [Dyadobacter arcticus]|uniref:Methylmalonyl-CoA mutase n=1 Tax=Dyadobacter arcticus TaxID=1078754 RepID=A0ABX0UPK2_9BACT|nr:methylmalonyl-CoA mutase family protein [Dyadobacter arcticus]NIJ54917.1 methylmalonyl-CoA mutase [Dyadobacter arcticus]